MQNWTRVKDLVASALERRPSERLAYLDQECPAELRAEVESLLAAADEESGFISKPALEAHETTDLDADNLPGSTIGPYRIISRIGEGGMGSVYRAARSDAEYHSQVAIKVLRRGIVSGFIISRFRAERQILARLNHPNIARLFDGGTTADGRPYFVMELIEGKPLDEYCDDKRLPTAERLRLFREVCGAVQYAHSNLIVHRDLKPTNILVTADGTPKLLDFGIAKILNPEGGGAEPEATMTFVRLMTPDYASPEQVRGEAITTATDVYTLGVILYELLSGHRPFRRPTSPHELERAICELDPEKPSSAVKLVENVVSRGGTNLVLTPEWVAGARDGQAERLMRRLRGDLDNIVLKAMRKNPAARYESAGQLSEDIRRHLENEPVIARPDTVGYRTAKFVRRNRTAAIAAAAVLIAVAGGVVMTALAARSAQRERARAERRFNDVRHLATSFLFEFDEAIRNLPGSTQARALVVKKAVAYLDSLSRESAGDNSLQRELADAYQKVAEVQGAVGTASLGDTAGAKASLTMAQQLREALHRANPQSIEDKMALAGVYADVGGIENEMGNSKAGLDSFQKAFRLREEVYDAHPSDLKTKRSLAVGYWGLGSAFADSGALEDSLKARLKSLELFKQVAQVNPTPGNRRAVALLHKNLSATLKALRRFDEALAQGRSAIAIDEVLMKEQPGDVRTRKDLMYSYGQTGECLVDLKRHREALDYYGKSLEIRKKLAEEDPKDTQARGALASMEYRVGMVLWDLGERRRSMEHHGNALKLREELAARDPASAHMQVDVAESLHTMASGAAVSGDRARSAEWRDRAVEIVTRLKNEGRLAPRFARLYEEIVAAKK